MNFIVDAQLPPALATWLIAKKHAAQHVLDLDLTGADDVAIWEVAVRQRAIIVTKDEDFAERTNRTSSGPPIVWLRIGNSTNRTLISWLEPRWPTVVQLLNDGDRLVEVR